MHNGILLPTLLVLKSSSVSVTTSCSGLAAILGKEINMYLAPQSFSEDKKRELVLRAAGPAGGGRRGLSGASLGEQGPLGVCVCGVKVGAGGTGSRSEKGRSHD